MALEDIAKGQNSALKTKMKEYQSYENGAVDFFKSLFEAGNFKFSIFSTRTYQQMSKGCTQFYVALQGSFSERQLVKLNWHFKDGPSSHLRELARSVVLKYYNAMIKKQ